MSKTGLFTLLGNNIKDRLAGNQSRANARLGLVSPPAGKSKLIWIRAGGSRDSVLLGAGLMAAIRHKRLDVRLVLTYDEEYQDIIVDQLSSLEKIGFGYACENSVFTESRMLERLSPFAIIFVGKPPGEGIANALRKHPVKHLVTFQCGINPAIAAEINFPDHAHKVEDEPSVEAMSLLMQAQVDTQLGALLKGENHQHIFLLALNELDSALDELLTQWQSSELLTQAILALYTADQIDALQSHLENKGMKVLRLSEWDRESAVADDVIVLVDEWRWFAATAASATAIHLSDESLIVFWQSMASATVVTVDNTSQLPIEINLPRYTALDLIPQWQHLSENTFECRKLSDENRRVFWDYRRQAQQGIDSLIQTVYDW